MENFQQLSKKYKKEYDDLTKLYKNKKISIFLYNSLCDELDFLYKKLINKVWID